MTTITRKELRAAIEAGIKKAAERWPVSFTDVEAAKLRAVAATATYVASGAYREADSRVPGGIVECPVVQAFANWRTSDWDGPFTDGYDSAVIEALGTSYPGFALRVVEVEDA